jgi:glutamate-1-semialdehyde 2,1-aminomutase
MNHATSEKQFQEANKSLVGGVNSPVRAFNSVGGTPFFVKEGKGPWLTDVDGNRYVDYIMSWGPLVHGHAHPEIIAAVETALHRGSSFGIPTEAETQLAEKIIDMVPSIEKVRLVNSGTEATMSAIRLARGFTGRDLVLKVEGCYHGHVDSLLVKAGSGLATLGIPASPGIPKPFADCTLTMPYNDLEAAKAIFEERGEDIACIIIEPVPGNMGCVLPEDGYLQGLRDLTKQYESLLIFDEVMTGFRASRGGVQELYGVTPDMTCLGKVIGGGLPVGAYGARADIMDKLAPLGPVYQAGTLSGNPLATAAGLTTLELLDRPGVIDAMTATTTKLLAGLEGIASDTGVPITHAQAGSMGGFFFNEGPVKNYADAAKSDTDRYGKYFWTMLENGVYFAPSQFEAFFLSSTHTDAEIDHTLEAARKAFEAL